MSEGPRFQPGTQQMWPSPVAGSAVLPGLPSPRSLESSFANQPIIPSSQCRLSVREVIDKWCFLRFQVNSKYLALALEWQEGQEEASGQKATLGKGRQGLKG